MALAEVLRRLELDHSISYSSDASQLKSLQDQQTRRSCRLWYNAVGAGDAGSAAASLKKFL